MPASEYSRYSSVDPSKSKAAKYVGRFAPTPSSHLHAGTLVVALASWLDAQAHQGKWLVRIDDLQKRSYPRGVDILIQMQLDKLGLRSDAKVIYQSERLPLYEAALELLRVKRQAYPCYCARKNAEDLIYKGTCHPSRQAQVEDFLPTMKMGAVNLEDPTFAWRFMVPNKEVLWVDRKLGVQSQVPSTEIGDIIVKRPDDVFSAQLASVVDDADQGVTDVVRSEDQAVHTVRQMALQGALGYTTPKYMHVPLVTAASGDKLVKKPLGNPLDEHVLRKELDLAAIRLGLQPQTGDLSQALSAWVNEWRAIWIPQPAHRSEYKLHYVDHSQNKLYI